MKTDKNTLFREKAEKYVCCFNEQCPLHSHCLRWEVGQYIDPAKPTVNCVNPRYQDVTDGQCKMYRNNQLVTMPVGMKTRFYQDMPARISQAIKAALIEHNCRTTYYEYHRGDRPITPAYLALIQQICNEQGWHGPLVFDGEVTDYVW